MGNELSAAERAGQMSAIDEEGVHSSNVYDNAELVTYTPDVATMHESFRLAVARYPGAPLLSRPFLFFVFVSLSSFSVDVLSQASPVWASAWAIFWTTRRPPSASTPLAAA